MTLRLRLPNRDDFITVDPGSLVSASPEVLDAHALVVLYGGDSLHLVLSGPEDDVALQEAVARVQTFTPEELLPEVRRIEHGDGLDPVEAEAMASIEAAAVEAMKGSAESRREVTADLAALLVRVLVRTSAR